MKKRERIRMMLCIVMLICSAAMGTSAAVSANAGRGDGAEASALKTEDGGFLLRDTGGRICVYEYGAPERPVMVTNISTLGMRTADRERLAAGVAVSSREELLSLLEDFGS